MPLLIADASPLVAFCCGSQHLLLSGVVQQTYGEVLVPHQVDVEIRRVAARENRIVGLRNYQTLITQQSVRVLSAATAYGPEAYRSVFSAVLDLLDAEDESIDILTRDAGEAFAVAHAHALAKAGRDTHILMDDGGGRDWARQYGIPTRKTLWVFQQARALGLISTRSQMAASYKAVRKYTGALPPLERVPELTAGLK